MGDKESDDTWKFRLPLALLFSPGVGLLIGYLVSGGTTDFEGASGYAFMYGIIFSMPFVFLAMLMIKSIPLQLLLVVLSCLGYAVLSSV